MSEDIKVTDGTVLEALNGKVDLDGGNYVGSGLEDVVEQTHWSKKITNCITEIPQRIKLELNNGTLTLKAGSEVIVPNGFEADGTTPKFDYVTIENDLTYKPTWGNGWKNFAYVFNNGTGLGMCREDYVSSGATEPTIKGSGQVWYDTANNIMKRYNGTTWLTTTNDTLFLAETTGGSDGIASIDQVFNGFGYIGSTVWVDKGVKGLIPNGRNEDGTLNNVEITTTKLTTTTNPFGANPTPSSCLAVTISGVIGVMHKFIESNVEPTTTYTFWFNPITNKILYAGATAGVWIEQNAIPVASLDWTYVADPKTNTFTSLIPKQPFRAVDYNDAVLKDTLIDASEAGIGFPSAKYANLTLGASGTTYTAPANGYVVFRKQATAVGQYVQLALHDGTQLQYWVQSATNNGLVAATIPVKKGATFVVSYTLAGSSNSVFNFVYAQGEV